MNEDQEHNEIRQASMSGFKSVCAAFILNVVLPFQYLKF